MKFIKQHYHWIVAAVLFLVIGIRGGIGNNMSSLHIIPVTEALNITRAQFSLAGSAGFVVAMLATMFSGILIQYFGYRLLLGVFLLTGAAAFFQMGKAETYTMFFLGNMLFGLANGICGDALTTRVVSSWFHRHKGTVLGVVASATGVGGGIMSIIQSGIIEKSSYHVSYYLSAILLAVCGVLAVVFIRNHPAQMGLVPYGDGEQVNYKKREHAQDHWHGFEMKQIIRRPAFYMMLIGTFLSCALAYLAFFVIVPHMQDRGLSAAQASSMQSVMLLCLAGAKILAGYLCDAIGARKVVLLCMGFNVAGLALLATAQGYVFGLIAVVVYTMSLPMTTVIIPLLASSLFGYHSQTQYNGIFISMVSAASIVASPVSNGIYDRIGTYSPVFLVGSAGTVLLMGVYLVMYRFADKDRKKYEATETV